MLYVCQSNASGNQIVYLLNQHWPCVMARWLVIDSTGYLILVSYGQDVHRRVGTAIGLAVVSLGIGALMALSKSKKHFIGLTWADGDKKGGVAFQADKNDYRGLLAGLEGVTGKKAVDTDTMTVKN